MRFAALAPGLAVIFAACSPRVLTTPVPVPAAGADIRYSTKADSTSFTRARLVSLDADSLVFDRLVARPAGDGSRWVAGSLPTASIAVLQVRAGSRNNAGRGALIGSALGLVTAIGCATEKGWLTPSPGQCFVGGAISGAATGAVIGLLVRSAVWAPAVLPTAPEPPVPPVTLR
jgi:hypothetical protein